MNSALTRKITPTRVATVCCAGLIAFGVVDVVLPHGAPSSAVVTASPSGHSQPSSKTESASGAQEVAVRFVIACDTTSPAAPSGDVATEAALAPRLASSDHPAWSAAWTAENRHTTVALDPPGSPVHKANRTVAVEVTGVMTVTSNTSPPEFVPVAETVLLRPTATTGSGAPGGSAWLVENVEVGA